MFIPHDTFQIERRVISEGKIIAGVDEVGRGSIAGPVYAAVVLVSSKDQYIPEVKDSKLLSRKKRERLFNEIKLKCLEYSVGSASEKEVDQMGIGNATARAMERAYMKLKNKPDEVIVDGASITKPNITCTMIRGGDLLHYSISAASIIAKVTRDRYMYRIAMKYPSYGMDHNVGYGTLEHRNAVEKYGVLDIHRKTFSPIKNMVGAEQERK